MKKILYPSHAVTRRRTNSPSAAGLQARRYNRRHGARQVIRIAASLPRPVAAYADLVGADRDHPLHYVHELYDVFEQFQP